MRRVLLGDLLAGAACIAQVPPAAQIKFAQRLICEADAAHRYVKRFGRAHLAWGMGDLQSRARAHLPLAAQNLSEAPSLQALAVLAQALAQRKAEGIARKTLALPKSVPMC